MKLQKILIAAAALVFTSLPAQATKVFMIGGATDNNNAEVYNALRASTGKNWSPNTSIYTNCSADWAVTTCPKIAVVTSAGDNYAYGFDVFTYDDPTKDALSYYNLFQKYGFSPKHVTLHVDNKATAAYSGNTAGNANIALINQADVVFFNGGDQARHANAWFTSTGADTPILAALRTRVNNRTVVVAGTSAGTAIQSNPTHGEGVAYGYLYFRGNLAAKSVTSSTGLKDDRAGVDSLQYKENGGKMQGFGFAGAHAIETHTDARSRLARLLPAMRNMNKTTGFGVDEDTALYLNNGVATVYGSKGVFIADTSTATFPSSTTYFKVTGAVVSYLTRGDTYKFSTKTVTSSKPAITSPYYGSFYDSNSILTAYEITKSMTYIVDTSSAANIGTAQVPVYEKAPFFPSNSPTIKFRFYKNSSTKGYYSTTSKKYTSAKVLVDIY